ncbi:MAG: two-component system response regulator RppA [Prochloraceae cyanobacterium]
MRILLVEDETDLGKAIERVLKQESYIVDLVQNGTEAWEYLDSRWTQYTVGIFDWLVPGISGLELLKKLRQNNSSMPVLMLTAKDTMSDRVEGLDAGADDYLIKPFGMAELLARLRALQRRSPQLQSQQLRSGNLILDYKTNSILLAEDKNNKPISLTAKEFQFLEYFMRHPEQIVTTDRLLNQLWELEAEPMSNVVAAQVRLVRKKLAAIDCEGLIETVYGLGYRFNPK